jgi:hypothetical protein
MEPERQRFTPSRSRYMLGPSCNSDSWTATRWSTISPVRVGVLMISDARDFIEEDGCCVRI